ncbi:universal stress protein [Billgrantia azerbaijanica]|nr:universal stress protein [Halomonas azerbaijanica]
MSGPGYKRLRAEPKRWRCDSQALPSGHLHSSIGTMHFGPDGRERFLTVPVPSGDRGTADADPPTAVGLKCRVRQPGSTPMSERVSLVIVPVDGSSTAAAATRHGAMLARLLGARLQLLHVMPLNPAELSDVPANRRIDADHDRAQRLERARRAFDRAREVIATPLDPSPEEVTLEDATFVRHPARAIVAHARSQRDCLLVIGARHLSEMGKFVEGSVSNEVVHRANFPVTVVHAESAPEEVQRIGRILLPVDGSRHSDKAATFAGELARSAGAGVELLFCRPATPAVAEDADGEAERIFRRARQVLGEVPEGVAERVLSGTHYAEAIVDQARHSTDYPLIIMGRRGLSTWRERLLGGVSHRVIDLAPCPVTVVV